MGTPEASREPCPDRILDDVGASFCMGAIGGSALHFLKGLHASPNGARLAGAFQAVRLNAPRIGGGFAVWGALFSATDCTMVYARQTEDPWNSIVAGATTGGLLSLRRGLGATVRSAAVGGAFLALIEGGSIMLGKALSMEQQQMPAAIVEEPLPAPTTAGDPPASDSGAGSEGWFAGWFGGGKKEEEKKSKGSETKILESFDAPPVPNFEYK